MIIIIPAHNEASVIRRTLSELLLDLPEDAIVIVSCNGCTDETATIARSFGDPVVTIETSTASKIEALNAADSIADAVATQFGVPAFPRIYQDADVVLKGHIANKLAACISRDGKLAASPRAVYRFHHCSARVRRYYRVWLRLPYVLSGMVGCGVYVLSLSGRERFGQFPDVISDDGFVRSLFNEEERASYADCVCEVYPPHNIVDLIKIKTRSRLGLYELDSKFPGQRQKTDQRNWPAIFLLVCSDPVNVFCLPIYLFVNLVSRIRARLQYASNRRRLSRETTPWERDESSRGRV